jgi:hypothetical protein
MCNIKRLTTTARKLNSVIRAGLINAQLLQFSASTTDLMELMNFNMENYPAVKNAQFYINSISVL